MNKPRLVLLALAILLLINASGTIAVFAESDFDVEQLVREIVESPALLAAIIGLAWNIGGYIIKSAEMHQLQKYDHLELIKTLALFETLFLILSTFGGLPTSYTSALSISLAFVRSLKHAVEEFAAKLSATAPSHA